MIAYITNADAMARLFEFAQHMVFWCSVASLFLATVERWMQKWYPEHCKTVSALADLVSQFGALNLRDKIAPKVWDGADRRNEEKK